MIDLGNCDREPIHIPGTIQPHGVLLALAEPSLAVVQVSANVGEHFSAAVEDVLGHPLSRLIDPASVDLVRESLGSERWYETNPLHIEAGGRQFDGIVHRYHGVAILELEPTLPPRTPMPMYHPFRPALMRMSHVSTLAELAEVVVEQVRRVTGFERVMLYRFHEDGHGSVDAEAREPALETYLGLHYPASDIPAQARRLYLKNWLRLIGDVRAEPAPIIPALRVDTGEPLDLTFSVLRSVSPIHLEYLANMGVMAAMSISLIVRDRLWGLISCLNHSGPRRVPYEMRAACEFFGRLTSLQIAALEVSETLVLRAARRANEEVLAAAVRASGADSNVLASLLARPEQLLGLVAAEGAAVVGDGPPATCGRCPPLALVQAIAAWVEEKGELGPFSTTSLAASFPQALSASDVASGILTFALPGAPPRRLLWFRPEVVKTVNWGGDPSKPVATQPGEGLRPRHSFALWQQEVRLHSHRWTASDLEAAAELRRLVIEVDVERRLSSEQRAVQARDDVIAVVSHDLRGPLSAILLEAELMTAGSTQMPGGGDADPAASRAAAERIHRAAVRMRALTDDLLDLARIEADRFVLHLESVPSRSMVEAAVREAARLAEAKDITLRTEVIDAPRVEADPGQVVRVLSNLVGNAIKFSPGQGAVTIRAECRDGELMIAVMDTGPGIPTDHLPHLFDRYWQPRRRRQTGAGLGLYIARGIVEAHGGRIWAESSTAGAKLTFTLPLAR